MHSWYRASTPLDAATVAALYPTKADYAKRFDAAAAPPSRPGSC